jgi:MFS family permease
LAGTGKRIPSAREGAVDPNSERAADFAARHFRWNFAVLVMDASTFFAGLAFLESTTVLPVLLLRLHAGDSVVGFARFLQTLGFTLPALLGAHFIHGRRRHKPFLLATCAIGRAGLCTLPAVFALAGERSPGFALAWFLAVWAVFWLLDGASAVSWFDIIGKTIPPRVRGRFFGVMQATCGCAAILSGLAVKSVLHRYGFPVNFVVLSLGMCAGVLLSLGFLLAVREPAGEVVEEARPGLTEFYRRAGPLLRRNPRLRRLLVIRLLLDGGAMAAPFYILFAERDLHVGLQMVGVYAVVQSAGKVLGGPVWGWISDHAGPGAGLRAVAVSITGIPLLALAARSAPELLFAVFALIGAVQDGAWMVGSNALLESVTDEERPLAVGVSSMFQAPGSLFGLAAGALAAVSSYPVVFGAAAALGGAALLLAMRTDGRHNAGSGPIVSQ